MPVRAEGELIFTFIDSIMALTYNTVPYFGHEGVYTIATRGNEFLNDLIRATKLKVITENGEQLTLSRDEALRMAKEAGLDLLVVAPNLEPPVAKILDYGHYKYDKDKKQKEARKKNSQKGNVLKELKLTPRIGLHDFNVRLKHGREFLTKGYKVKLTIFFKGRENTHPEIGYDLIAKYLAQIEDLGWTDSPTLKPYLMGRMMTLNIIPGLKRREEPIPNSAIPQAAEAVEVKEKSTNA